MAYHPVDMGEEDRAERRRRERDRRRGLAYLGIEPSAQERWSPMEAAAGEGEVLVYGPIVSEDEAAWYAEYFADETLVSAARFRAALADIAGDVVVRINSPGGLVWEAASMHTALIERRRAGDTVSVTVDGLAASAAAVVMIAGVRIEIAALGAVMLHRGWAVQVGSAEDMAAMAETLDQIDLANAALYAPRMSMTPEQVLAELAEERWYIAQEAVDAGLVDGIVSPSMDRSAASSAPGASMARSRLARLTALFGGGAAPGA